MTTKNPEHFDGEARLTAYVLGELSAEEAAALQRQIESDAELRAEVDAIAATARSLAATLAHEPAPGLTDAQRRRVTSSASKPSVLFTIFATRRAWAGVGLAAAACLVLAWWIPTLSRPGAEGPVAFSDAPAEKSELDARQRKQAEPERGRQRGGRMEKGGEAPRGADAFDIAAAASPSADAGAGGGLRGGGGVGRRAPGRARPAPGTAVPSLGSPPAAATLAEAEPMDKDADDQLHDRLAGALMEQRRDADREAYGTLVDNPFVRAAEEPLSTFSIDVDTASYANVRRILAEGRMPPPDAVRIEEMINYFDYGYEEPDGEHPFSVRVDAGACPWNEEHRLVRIGLKGRDVPADMRPATNLVFLIDVSGSMNRPEKLPLVKESLALLVEHLTADDRVAMVVYAGAAGLVLDSTYCDQREAILAALDRLEAGGSTNGGAGIDLAYRVAQDHFIDGGVNRVILCTDGDLNVGVTDQGSLDRLIEEKRASGVELSVLGFGRGNWQDDRMESLSNKGNGNCAYVDTLEEARKVLVEDMSGTLVTIAKDVKVQVDFNPARVNAYRLIGYANRLLDKQDFRDDTKDAGEIGAGHTVTALYEVVPAGVEIDLPEVEASKYVTPPAPEAAGTTEISDEMLTVRLRYKPPAGEESVEVRHPLIDTGATLEEVDEDFRFAAAVAGLGMILRDSSYRGAVTIEGVLDLAASGLGADEKGRRAEFMEMAGKARVLRDAMRRGGTRTGGRIDSNN